MRNDTECISSQMTDVCLLYCVLIQIDFSPPLTKLLEEKRNLPFAEFLERWTNDAPALHDTVSAHPDISQVAPDDAVIHDNSLRNPERNTC